MKKKLVVCCALTVLAISVMAQAPKSFSYQAVARDQNGNLMGSQSLTIRIGILQDAGLIWQEDHSITTNAMGLFSLTIGDLDASNTSGTVGSFADIPWGEGSFQLQVSVDAGAGFTELGTNEFQSVPFALYAATGPAGPGGSGTDNQVLSLTGNILEISGGNSVDLSAISSNSANWDVNNDSISTFNYVGIGTTTPSQTTLAVQGLNVSTEVPLFEVRREDGFPVFAVYNDGVMVFVDDAAKGVKGGFAVGGYNRASKGVSQEYLRVTPDSVRVYVPESTQAKGKKGGFAVGGYNRATKGPIQDFLTVTPDSTRVYVPNKANDPGVIGLQGGFAVSGFNTGAKAGGQTDYLMGINRGITRFNTTDRDRGFAIGSQEDGWGSNYLELTPTNSFIGSKSGFSNVDVDPLNEWGFGTMNVFVGYQSGMDNQTGHHNTFLGFCAGTKTIGGDIDYPELGSQNVFIGSQAGFQNTSGFNNVYIGYHAGINNSSGNLNVFIGDQAGANSVDIVSSIFIGNSAGSHASGNFNTFIGDYAGAQATTGQYNVALGTNAGWAAGGDNNVMIGPDAGRGSAGSSSFSANTLVGSKSGMGLTLGFGNSFFGNNSGQATQDGNYNTFVGNDAGFTNTAGSGNVFLGNRAGYFETGNNALYIGNTDTDYPLIFGFFDGFYVELNGDVTVAGTLFEASDAKLKTNIEQVTNPLDKLKQINGVSFQWKDQSLRKGAQPGSSIGFIAQEVETVFPSLVNEDRKGTKAVNYSGMIPVLLEAIKEQQSQIEALEQRIVDLER